MQSVLFSITTSHPWLSEGFRTTAIVVTFINLILFAPLINAGADHAFGGYVVASWLISSALYLLSYRCFHLIGMILFSVGLITSWLSLTTGYRLIMPMFWHW